MYYVVRPYYSVLLWSLYTTETCSHQPLPFLSAFSQSTSTVLGLTESPPPFVFFSTTKNCRVFYHLTITRPRSRETAWATLPIAKEEGAQ